MRKQIDWTQIERKYRAGILSLRTIASEHGVTEGAVRKRANKEGWDRDLAAKIKQRAEALVRKAEAEVRNVVKNQACVLEANEIAVNAQAMANVIMGHKSGASRMSATIFALLEEIELEGSNKELLEKLVGLMVKNDELDGKRMELVMKAISLPSRVISAERLVNAYAKLVTIQRQAYGIDRDEEKPKDPLENMNDAEILAELEMIFGRMKVIEGQAERV